MGQGSHIMPHKLPTWGFRKKGFVLSAPRACLHSRHRDTPPDGFTPLTSHGWRPRSKNTQQTDPWVLSPLSLPRKVWEQKCPSYPCVNHLHVAFLPHSSSSTFPSSKLVSLHHDVLHDPYQPRGSPGSVPLCGADVPALVPLRLRKNTLHTQGHSGVPAFGNHSHQGLSLTLCGAGSV